VQKYRYKSYAEAANFYCLVPLIEKQKTVLWNGFITMELKTDVLIGSDAFMLLAVTGFSRTGPTVCVRIERHCRGKLHKPDFIVIFQSDLSVYEDLICIAG
jgi:hypothetical protein